jgi:UDP-N-acetylglucosamine 2-epimerase (non-hydrolysing)
MAVFGTRPEAIKMCPLVKRLRAATEIETSVCLTGQHREMLAQVMEAFHIAADRNLDIMKKFQSLTAITAEVLMGIGTVLDEGKPDIVLVHGDTSTSFAAALAAFYRQIPVGHVEAGLRTGDKYSPYPEEMNRRLTGQIAELHFAPTALNASNLKKEHITENIFITGNTVIDAFQYTVSDKYTFADASLRNLDLKGRRLILMTAHRRENLGAPLESICRAALSIVNSQEDTELVYPVHLNPAVRETAFRILSRHPRIHLTDPVNVLDMHNLISKSYLLLTDSGGLQEEAPSLGVPVLVLRTETERPEAVEAGTVRVVGVEERDIVRQAILLLTDSIEYGQMKRAVNPYGDGRASERIVGHLLDWHRGCTN